MTSVIGVGFREKEFSVEESDEIQEIYFTIVTPVNVDTHCLILAMTYQEYDSRYAGLKEQYPDLERFTLYNEYDQAECKPAVIAK